MKNSIFLVVFSLVIFSGIGSFLDKALDKLVYHSTSDRVLFDIFTGILEGMDYEIG
jgi:hypothetical protein